MKKLIILITVTVIALLSITPVYAEDGKVTYDGKAQEFIFEPGSDFSPTDLFANFKGVMPGDSLTQKITVKNNASNKVKVKIYMRSLGAHENSVEFLSKMNLKVQKSEENKMAYMFDAAADQTDGLTDWVCLGTLYSGGEVNLDVVLEVPTDLDNDFKNQVGFLNWEFKVEEFPIESSDPSTGDDSNIWIWVSIMAAALVIMIILILLGKKGNKNDKNN